MAGLTLLEEARAAGLTVRADGEQLVVRGPRSAEVLARALLAQKTAVLAALAPSPDFSRSRVPAFPRCTDEESTPITAASDPALARRVAAMRARHPRPWRCPPFLTAHDVPRGAGGCHSCGEPLQPLTDGLSARCAMCAHAARLLLDENTDEGRRA